MSTNEDSIVDISDDNKMKAKLLLCKKTRKLRPSPTIPPNPCPGEMV